MPCIQCTSVHIPKGFDQRMLQQPFQVVATLQVMLQLRWPINQANKPLVKYGHKLYLIAGHCTMRLRLKNVAL
uniref:Uncharacterized protein n=1 Tax=Anguilla anguilla TaxID=7936 RepID=A0A0E9PEI4_ANGAN